MLVARLLPVTMGRYVPQRHLRTGVSQREPLPDVLLWPCYQEVSRLGRQFVNGTASLTKTRPTRGALVLFAADMSNLVEERDSVWITLVCICCGYVRVTWMIG